MHCDSCDLAIDHLALPGVQAGAHVEPEVLHRLRDRAGAPDRARRAVEAGKEAIACLLDLAASETLEL